MGDSEYADTYIAKRKRYRLPLQKAWVFFSLSSHIAESVMPATMPLSSSSALIRERIALLRETMQQYGLAAWIVPMSDPHLSEYLPEHWASLQWLSGFTGSAGLLVVTSSEAVLWVDSRYWVQASHQLKGTGIQWAKWYPRRSDVLEWIAEHLEEGQRAGVDGTVISMQQAAEWHQHLSAAGCSLDTSHDVMDDIWQDRPALPTAEVYAHDEHYVPTSCTQKLAKVRKILEEEEVAGHFISSLDDIAWLFNLRGQDVDYNPVFLAHAWVDDKQAVLFVDESRLASGIKSLLEKAGVVTAPYDSVGDWLAAHASDSVLLDCGKVSAYIETRLPANVELINAPNPTTLFKACKEPQALAHVRNAMVQDGIALVEFLHAFEEARLRGELWTELDVDTYLSAARARRPGFVSLSFPTIAGYNENGALPHYQATQSSYSTIEGNGLLLIDSGAQYLGGTTDITRVLAIGMPSDAQCADYTTVLKGTIALSRAHFPEGIPAPMLDAIARAPLWQQNLDFGHGTGHGVGYFLNVHEGPQSISFYGQPNGINNMREGMITSIEPGLYREGEWGIRIENLVANVRHVDNAFGSFMRFETLTLCPIDMRPIDVTLLTHEEIAWLDTYHEQVRERLMPHLTGAVREWLECNTLPLVTFKSA